MYEIADVVSGWQHGNRRFVLARTTTVEGFGQRWAAQAAAISDDGMLVGSLLGGVAGSAVASAAARLLDDPGACAGALVPVTATQPQAAAAGLACGGHATLLLQREDCLPAGLWPLLAAGAAGVVFTALAPGQPRPSYFVDTHGQGLGSLGDPALDEAAGTLATTQLLRTGRSVSEIREIAGRQVHAEVLFPVPSLVVIGNGHLSEALSRMAETLDWQVTIRPGAADDQAMIAALPASAAVVILSHDLDIAAPALAAALSSAAGYVGAVGSRKTQAGRAGRLRTMGVSDQSLARIHGPAGLDLGARTPAEIALSICAEILAERESRTRTPLSQLGGPIHQPAAAAPTVSAD